MVGTIRPSLGLQPADALGVHLPAFALQQHGQAKLAVAHTAAVQFSQMYPQGSCAGHVILVAQRHSLDPT